MDGHVDKRRETTPRRLCRRSRRQADHPPKYRLPALESLPQELLDKVMGSLRDVPSLRTARLVCKALLHAASGFVWAATVPVEDLRSHPHMQMDAFPCASRVAISGSLEADDLALLAQRNLSFEVTHVRISDITSSSPLTLPYLPSLQSMHIGRFPLDNSFHFPASLQELHLGARVSSRNGDALTRMTQLTSLELPVREHSNMPFEALTTLTNLQCLVIEGGPSILPCLGALSLLTSLEWECHGAIDQPFDLAPFTRLQNLVHLKIGPEDLRLAAEHLETIGQISSLRSLDLDVRGPMLPDTALLAPLSGLTGLRQYWCCLDGRSLQRMNIEGLQQLDLGEASKLGEASEAVTIMQRATGLTSLSFIWGKRWSISQSAQFSLALSHMTRLQSLYLDPGPLGREGCFEAIGHLTGLLCLHWRGWSVSNADVAACANLRKLWMLSIIPEHFAPSGPVSLEVFLAVATLPELSRLELGRHLGIWGDYVTDEISARFNTERTSRGRRPLVLEFR